MTDDREKYSLFTRRMILLAGGKIALVSALIGRMYYLQIVEGEKYSTLSDKNRISIELLPPQRGEIYDRRGAEVAVNRQTYRVLMISEQAGDVGAALNRLSEVIPISQEDRSRVQRMVKRRPGFVPVVIRENLVWEETARIEVNTPKLPGIFVDHGQTRFYPFTESMAHVIGFVAEVSESDLSGDPLLGVSGFRIGKAGIEKSYDEALRGAPGSRQVEVNAYGRAMRELSRKKARPGASISLTIDTSVQNYVYDRLKDQSAAAVVLDIHSGDVLAMASTPSFDPNAVSEGMNLAEWNALLSNPMGPLNNRAIAGQFAPGSTFKMMVALSALSAKSVTPETVVRCPGYYDLGGTRFHCWKRSGHGQVTLNKAITESCDVYFYEIARRTGIEAISEMAGRFGLGRNVGIDLPGEKPGLLPTPQWKMAVLGEKWHDGETVISGIGQGFVLATPLQLAVMTARLANGGREIIPRLLGVVSPALDAQVGQAPSAMREIGVEDRHLQLVCNAMISAVNSPRGTAFSARIEKPEMEMAGKTGTAQVRRISVRERKQGVRKNDSLPWNQRDHALFVGFAPVRNPRFAISVVIEHGGSGSKAAAPIARDVFATLQRLYPVSTNSRISDSSDAREA